MDDGGLAFPSQDNNTWYLGMTLRDYFAGRALTGFFAGWTTADNANWSHLTDETKAARFAKHAYFVADAMIAARQKDSSQ